MMTKTSKISEQESEQCQFGRIGVGLKFEECPLWGSGSDTCNLKGKLKSTFLINDARLDSNDQPLDPCS